MDAETIIARSLTELRTKITYDAGTSDLLFNAIVIAEARLHVMHETGSMQGAQISDFVDMLTVIHHLGSRQPTADLGLSFDYAAFLLQIDEMRRRLIVQAFDLKAIDRLQIAAPIG